LSFNVLSLSVLPLRKWNESSPSFPNSRNGAIVPFFFGKNKSSFQKQGTSTFLLFRPLILFPERSKTQVPVGFIFPPPLPSAETPPPFLVQRRPLSPPLRPKSTFFFPLSVPLLFFPWAKSMRLSFFFFFFLIRYTMRCLLLLSSTQGELLPLFSTRVEVNKEYCPLYPPSSANGRLKRLLFLFLSR